MDVKETLTLHASFSFKKITIHELEVTERGVKKLVVSWAEWV